MQEKKNCFYLWSWSNAPKLERLSLIVHVFSHKNPWRRCGEGVIICFLYPCFVFKLPQLNAPSIKRKHLIETWILMTLGHCSFVHNLVAKQRKVYCFTTRHFNSHHENRHALIGRKYSGSKSNECVCPCEFFPHYVLKKIQERTVKSKNRELSDYYWTCIQCIYWCGTSKIIIVKLIRNLEAHAMPVSPFSALSCILNSIVQVFQYFLLNNQIDILTERWQIKRERLLFKLTYSF